jgi:hypothetical protein
MRETQQMAIFQQPASDHDENLPLGELNITKNGVACQPERPRGKCFLETGKPRSGFTLVAGKEKMGQGVWDEKIDIQGGLWYSRFHQ